MTTDITKNLASMEDFSSGTDSEVQTRGGVDYTVKQVPIPYPVKDLDELAALDVEVYTLARFFIGTSIQDYIYDATTEAGLPSSGVGTWVEMYSGSGLAVIVGATYTTDAQFKILGDYTKHLPTGTQVTLAGSVASGGQAIKAIVNSTNYDGTNTTVTLTEEVVTEDVATASFSNYSTVLDGVTGEFEDEADIVFAGAGYQIVGDFADVPKVQLTLSNQVYTSKSIVGYEDALWRCTEDLPYTPTGDDPTTGDELGKWVVVSVGELKTIARAFNVADEAVLYSTNTSTVLDDVEFVHDLAKQKTWRLPTLAGPGETIVSVLDNALTTSVGTYLLTIATEYGWGLTADDTSNNTVMEDFELWLVDTSNGPTQRYLPLDPPDGLQVMVRDKTGNAKANPITIFRNGSTIEEQYEDIQVATNYSQAMLRYIGSEGTWRVIGGGVGAQVVITSTDIMSAMMPVGHGIMTRNPNNPADYYYFGTWVRASVGKMLGGVGTSSDMNGYAKELKIEANPGEWVHKQTGAEVGSHAHEYVTKDHLYGGSSGSAWDSEAPAETELNRTPEEVQAMNIANPTDGWYVWERTE